MTDTTQFLEKPPELTSSERTDFKKYGACHLADNGGSTKCPPLRGVLEVMQSVAFLDKFISSGDTAKINVFIGNTLF